ncbi:MAG: hypothetical protein PVI30_20810 [Myxococcales bacterium]
MKPRRAELFGPTRAGCASLPRALLVAGLLWLGGCASLPDDPATRGLYVDLRKAVDLSDDTGWVVDRVQLEANAEAAMRSVCQVQPHLRDDLDAWLGGQIELEGGPAAAGYREHGDLGEVDEALQLERTRMLLRYADDRASADCPFWLEPDPQFRGVQGDADRFVVLLESGGFGAIFVRDGEASLGGGGGGRVMLGRGFGSRLTLAAGGELGGFGGLTDNESGARRIDASIAAAVPVLARLSFISRIVDLEVAPVWRFNPGEDSWPPGIRTTVGAGVATMRSTAFMPYLVGYIGYEYQPERDLNPESHLFMLGTRVGVDLDP